MGLKDKGYLAMGGQIIDATIVSAPKQHNSREENETIKDGETPKDWKRKPAKNRQKDKDARWTKKNERSYFGYKNHIGVDRRHKFVRRYVVSDASVHDSQKLEDVLDASNTASDVWADSAYRSQEIEKKLAERGLKSRIHRRAYRNRQLSEAQQAANKMRSKVRARVEHVFGDRLSGSANVTLDIALFLVDPWNWFSNSLMATSRRHASKHCGSSESLALPRQSRALSPFRCSLFGRVHGKWRRRKISIKCTSSRLHLNTNVYSQISSVSYCIEIQQADFSFSDVS